MAKKIIIKKYNVGGYINAATSGAATGGTLSGGNPIAMAGGAAVGLTLYEIQKREEEKLAKEQEKREFDMAQNLAIQNNQNKLNNYPIKGLKNNNFGYGKFGIKMNDNLTIPNSKKIKHDAREITGDKHNQDTNKDGIKGTPVFKGNQQVAEVEKGEIEYNGFVFSDSIPKDLSFAKRAKQIIESKEFADFKKNETKHNKVKSTFGKSKYEKNSSTRFLESNIDPLIALYKEQEDYKIKNNITNETTEVEENPKFELGGKLPNYTIDELTNDATKAKEMQQFLVNNEYTLPKYGVDGKWGEESQNAYNNLIEKQTQIKDKKIDVVPNTTVEKNDLATTNKDLTKNVDFKDTNIKIDSIKPDFNDRLKQTKLKINNNELNLAESTPEILETLYKFGDNIYNRHLINNTPDIKNAGYLKGTKLKTTVETGEQERNINATTNTFAENFASVLKGGNNRITANLNSLHRNSIESKNKLAENKSNVETSLKNNEVIRSNEEENANLNIKQNDLDRRYNRQVDIISKRSENAKDVIDDITTTLQDKNIRQSDLEDKMLIAATTFEDEEEKEYFRRTILPLLSPKERRRFEKAFKKAESTAARKKETESIASNNTRKEDKETD